MTTSPDNVSATALTMSQETLLAGRVLVERPFRAWPCTLQDFEGGAFSYVSPGAALHSVQLGRYCSVGDHVTILSHHPIDSLSTSPVFYQPLFSAPFESAAAPDHQRLLPTLIGNDVWIGAGVQIKTGVTIGDGAVIGAGSVVTRDVAPYTIVGGVPARLIRARFPAAMVERLQALAWWRFNVLGLPLQGKSAEDALDLLEAAVAAGQLQPYEGQRFVMARDRQGKITAYRWPLAGAEE